MDFLFFSTGTRHPVFQRGPFHTTHVYCLLPSKEMHQGRVSIFKSRPLFLNQFSFCLQVDPKIAAITNPLSFSDTQQAPDDESRSLKSCKGCFVTHFPRPNSKHCKLTKSKDKIRNETFGLKMLT